MKEKLASLFAALSRPPVKWVSLAVLAIVLMGIGVGIAMLMGDRNASSVEVVQASPNPSPVSTTPNPTPSQQTTTSWLTNEASTNASLLNKRPLAVIIENHPDARPQAGLSDADIVYEAIAEGGITRFMAVYADATKPIRVGPIRSARTYFVDMATELGAMFAHVGGNMDALDQIKATSNFYDLDQFSVGSPVFARDASRRVATEHTMFSTTNGLWEHAITKFRYPATIDAPETRPSANVLPKESRPAANTTEVLFSSPTFATSWSYNPETNRYTRSMAGALHRNAGDNAQIEVQTVILQTVDRQAVRTRINEDGWKFTLTGSGRARILQNGVMTEATWKKEGRARTRYYDASGGEIGLLPGKQWVAFIHPDTTIRLP